MIKAAYKIKDAIISIKLKVEKAILDLNNFDEELDIISKNWKTDERDAICKIRDAIVKIKLKNKAENLDLADFKDEINIISKYWNTVEGKAFVQNLQVEIPANDYEKVLNLCSIYFDALEEEIYLHSNN